MDGIGWLIKNMLESQGIKIDPNEIKETIETAKVLIPRIATSFAEQKATLDRIEAKLDRVKFQRSVPSEMFAVED
jgi:hypothetical protein